MMVLVSSPVALGVHTSCKQMCETPSVSVTEPGPQSSRFLIRSTKLVQRTQNPGDSMTSMVYLSREE